MDSALKDHAEALYYHIAGDAIECAERESDEFRLAQYVCASMVFSALTLEAYINQQYQSRPETQKLALRSMEVRLKWQMLPLLLGSKETFVLGAMPFQTSHSLITLRDALVHFKPRGKISKRGGGKPDEIFSVVVKDVAGARAYFACIPAMIHKLAELTSRQTDVPLFLKGGRYLSSISLSAAPQLPGLSAKVKVDN
jgi:hypothetical protein